MCIRQIAYFHLLFLILVAGGEKCRTLIGIWYDDLGSQLKLNHSEDGILFGHYTAVNGKQLGFDMDSRIKLDVTGTAVFNQTGAVFGFNVMLKSGETVKSWTGQCLICGGKERLETSWLLNERVDSCSDMAQSTKIGKSVFTRQRNDLFQKERRNRGVFTPKEPTVTRPTSSPICSLNGFWYNELGSEMLIVMHQNRTLTGEYRTAVERYKGAAGKSYSKIYGVSVPFAQNSTMAMHVIWNNGTSVTGWVGQCQLCGSNQTETLITTWLLTSNIQTCADSWKSTLFGQNIFTRHEQGMGPRRRLGIDAPVQPSESVTEKY